MSEPKIKCVDCEAEIQVRTPVLRNGRCLGCHLRFRTVPPGSSAKLREAYARLLAVGENPVPILHNRWPDDEKSVFEHIESAEKLQQLYQKWAPKLRAFIGECRRDASLPQEKELSSLDRGKQKVYETVLQQQKASRDRVQICCMPLLGIAVAQNLWPVQSPDVVYLSREEFDRWLELCDEMEGQWYSFYDCSIDDNPECQVGSSKRENGRLWIPEELLEGEKPWLVSVNHHGYGYADLWGWNGVVARKIRKVWDMIS